MRLLGWIYMTENVDNILHSLYMRLSSIKIFISVYKHIPTFIGKIKEQERPGQQIT